MLWLHHKPPWCCVGSFVICSDNLLTSILVCKKHCQSVEAFVLEGLQLFSSSSFKQLSTTRRSVLDLRTALSWDERCEVRANATARADWVILHSVIILITILPPLSLYLDWSLLSGTRLHPRGFISDSLSSPTLTTSLRLPPPLRSLSDFSFPFVCRSFIFVLLYLL